MKSNSLTISLTENVTLSSSVTSQCAESVGKQMPNNLRNLGTRSVAMVSGMWYRYRYRTNLIQFAANNVFSSKGSVKRWSSFLKILDYCKETSINYHWQWIARTENVLNLSQFCNGTHCVLDKTDNGSLAISRAWRRLHAFALNSDWSIALFTFFLIGRSNYFGLGFTTLI